MRRNLLSSAAPLAASLFLPSPSDAGVMTLLDAGSAASSVLTPCPFGSALPDGCAGAPTAGTITVPVGSLLNTAGGSAGGGNVQFSNFFSSRAPQSGQTYATRPQWNVAGVDYPVGIAAGTTLQDPTAGGLPSGCSYSGTTFKVNCSTSGVLTLSGWDFSVAGGMQLVLSGTGCYIIENNYFAYAGAASQANYLVFLQGATTGTCDGSYVAVFTNNMFDGFGANWPSSGIAFIGGNASATATLLEYNAFMRAPARDYEKAGVVAWQYNYAEGLVYSETGNHGEQLLGAITALSYTYSAFLQPGTQVFSGTTAAISPWEGSASGFNVNPLTVDHSVFVANITQGNVITSASWSGSVVTFSPLNNPNYAIGTFFTVAGMANSAYNGTWRTTNASNTVPLTAAMASNPGTSNCPGSGCGYLSSAGIADGINIVTGAITYGALAFTNNYLDPTGMLACFASSDLAFSAAAWDSGNGGEVVFSTVGEISNNLISAGQIINVFGAANTAYNGTYTVASATSTTVTVPLASNPGTASSPYGTIYAQTTSLAVTGNVNLLDNSAVTGITGYPDPPGPAYQCNGAY